MKNQNFKKERRRSIRLKNYDYSAAGAYFVTVCVNEWRNLFGGIENGKMALSTAGEVARFTWNDLTRHNTSILLDEFVIMPNHMHRIIIIKDSVGAGSKPALVNINSVWQRNYYEHIIRDDNDLNRIREYIVNNPVKWKEDEYYVQ